MLWGPGGSPPMLRMLNLAPRLWWSVTVRSDLPGVLSAKQMGAKRIIAMSRHASRQKLAREFGATDIVTERGNEGRAAGSNLRNLGASLVPRCRDKKNVYLPMLEVLSKGGGRESRANLSPAQKKRRRGTHF